MWLLPAVAIVALVLLVRWWLAVPRREQIAFGLARVYAAFWQRWQRSVPTYPRHGPALVVVNHTCSADPMFLLADAPRTLAFITTRQHYNIHPLVRRILSYAGCVPVQRGGHDPVGVRLALRCLAAGRILVVFPEGNLSGVELGRMRRWQYGAAYLALKSGVPVFPAWIEGGPRTDELLKAWLCRSGKAVRVHYGAAVDLTAYRRRKITRALLEEVTELLMGHVHALQPRRRITAATRK